MILLHRGRANPLIVKFLDALNHIRPYAFQGWYFRTSAVMRVLVAACLGFSAVTYWAIERPFLKRKERIAWWQDETPEIHVPVQANPPTSSECAPASPNAEI